MPIISQCTISQNNFGIVVFSKSAPDLGRYPKVENSSIGENKIFNNFEYNVYNHSTNTLYAQNNYWNVTSRADIQQALFDKNNNPAYGEVIFVPIYRQPRRQKQIPAVIVLKDDNLNKPPIVDTTVVAEVKVEDQTPEIDSSNTLAVATIPVVTEKLNTSEENLETNNQEEESPPIAENVSDLQPTETGEPVNEKPVMKEPILEVFLDSGKRQYYKRVMPQYPDIYMRTGTEGDVFIEVVVDRKGQIEDYRVLRSDGDYFTKAAIEALNEFRYKPGLYQGQPISFKTVERFRFKMQF
jgi:TonB family protein